MSDAPASKSGFPENPHSKPLDSAMIVSITDALVCFGQLLIIAGVVTEEQVVSAFRAAERQALTAQPALVDPEQRSLIARVIADFFEQRGRPPRPLN